MSKSWRISRRTALRGLGTAVSLPILEAMRPAVAWASRSVDGFPNRMAFFFIPNGAHMPDWTPEAEGAEFELRPTLEPLAPFRDKLLVLSGLTHDKARPNGDGPGDHARSMAAFLTGCQPKKTDGADIRVGVSVDQVAAERIGGETRLPSLELGCDRGAQSGNCDSGYSCAYSSNISWKGESTPLPKEVDPRIVFERLFGSPETAEGRENRARRDRYRKSILDFVLDDAARLRARLGATDQRKLDEYLTAVREIEGRIARAEDESQRSAPPIAVPPGEPEDYQEHARLLLDLLAVGFQTDSTRVSTFVLANDGSNRSYPAIGVPDGHHDLSHHGRDEEKQKKIAQINRFHISQLAYFVEKLASIQEGDGTLLDHAMLAYGSGIGDGDRHNHDELPVILIGGGCGTLATGRHVRYPTNTPLNNLWLSMLDRMEVSVDELGDSTGRLEGLEA